MPISGITIEGLEKNNYLINNPIWIKIYDNVIGMSQFNSMIMDVGNERFEYKFVNNVIVLNLAPIIKMIMEKPDFRNVQKNILTKDILFGFEDGFQFYQYNPGEFENKSFIRGGRFMGANNSIPFNTILSPSSYIPYWSWLHGTFDVLTQNGIETHSNISELNKSHEMMSLPCGGVYIKFLNSMGGYSYWFFNEYTINIKGGGGDKIDNFDFSKPQNHFHQMGDETNISIDVVTRSTSIFFSLMRDLCSSTEVAIYQPNKLFQTDYIFDETNDWVKIENQSNQISISSDDRVKDFNFTFNLPMTHNNKL